MERKFRLNWPILVEEAVRRRQGMKLTQKQLAALAKVSTPTVSRFENNAKDLQLSSALAILEMLGMTDRRTLVFADDAFVRDAGDAVTFWGQDGDTRIRCRISREALGDHCLQRRQAQTGCRFRAASQGDRGPGAPQISLRRARARRLRSPADARHHISSHTRLLAGYRAVILTAPP